MEYVQCLWIKFSCINYWKKATVARFHVGLRPQHLCTGGILADGSDAANDLSLMCLQSSIDVGLQNPAIRTRIHERSAPEYLRKVAELVASGMGHPSIFNDTICVRQCIDKGVPPEEAWDYTLVGCPAVQIPAKEPGFSYGGLMNLAAALELALYNGVWQKDGRRIGPETGDVHNFRSFGDLVAAFKSQVENLARAWQVANLIVEEVRAEVLPTPFNSALVEGCIEKGMDKAAGGAKYNFTPYLTVVGLADTVDSLAAVKKLVFEERKLDWDVLFAALDTDFEGCEPLRHTLMDRMPKYGNDDDYVDEIANRVGSIASEAIKRYSNNYRGNDGASGISFMSLEANVSFGKSVGALPNGRYRHDALADTSSPVHGCDKNGPTAILKSSSKMDHVAHGEPTILNLWFSPSALREPSTIIPLLKGFVDLEVSHVQANVIDRDTLLAAQEDPEKHRTLLVRVSGYNAYFTELDKEIQDDIIGRTTYEAV